MTALIAEPKSCKIFRYHGNDFYGLAVFNFDGTDYLAGTVEQAEAAARLLVRNYLAIASAETIIKYSALPAEAIDLVRYFQSCSCAAEENETLAVLITEIDALIEETLATQGRTRLLCLDRQPIERSLINFPLECREEVQRELGGIDETSIYLYRLG